MKVKQIKDIVAFIIIVSSAFITALVLSNIKFVEDFELSLINERFKGKSYLKPMRQVQSGVYDEGEKVNSDIMIIGIDETSVSDDFLGPFPWERSVYANFLKYFRHKDGEYAPHYIFFDIFFDQKRKAIANDNFVKDLSTYIYEKKPWRSSGRNEQQFIKKLYDIYKQVPTSDTIFFNELKNHNNVFVDYITQPSADQSWHHSIIAPRLPYLLKHTLFPKNPEVFVEERTRQEKLYFTPDIKPPVEEVLKSTLGAGSAQVDPDSDGVVRKMPLVFLYDNENLLNLLKDPVFLPTIDLMIAMKYLGVTPKDLEIVFGQHIKIKNAKVPQKTCKQGEGCETKSYIKKDITIPIDKEGKMYINYQGVSRSFENLSYAFVNMDVDYNNVATYKNKLLLVGFYSIAGLGETKDYHPTPYDILYGIEIHANALYTIFNDEFISEVPGQYQYTFLIILVFGLTFFMFRLNIVKGLIIGFLVLFLIFIIGVFFFTGSIIGIKVLGSPPLLLVNMMNPILSIVITIILTVSYKVLTEEKDKKRIKGIFGSYVNPQVVSELLTDPSKLELGGETREISIMFSDIRGFTSLSENLAPQDLVLFLNKYLSYMTEVVMVNQGTLDKYIGDAIMAFWGAPIYFPEHAYLACKTAIEMLRKLDIYNSEVPENIQIDIGIGINTGETTVGNMGSEMRKNYTAMSDSVNLSSRLEGVNKEYKTRIIISEFTYALVKDFFIVRELDLIRVKGKKKPVAIYELIGFKEEVEELGYDFNSFIPNELVAN